MNKQLVILLLLSTVMGMAMPGIAGPDANAGAVAQQLWQQTLHKMVRITQLRTLLITQLRT